MLRWRALAQSASGRQPYGSYLVPPTLLTAAPIGPLTASYSFAPFVQPQIFAIGFGTPTLYPFV